MKSLTTNNLGKTFLVEKCQKVTISDFLRDYKKQVRDAIIKLTVDIDGVRVSIVQAKTGNGGHRHFYLCPICNKRAGVLFKHPLSGVLACRCCSGLEYKKRRYKGMLESQI